MGCALVRLDEIYKICKRIKLMRLSDSEILMDNDDFHISDFTFTDAVHTNLLRIDRRIYHWKRTLVRNPYLQSDFTKRSRNSRN